MNDSTKDELIANLEARLASLEEAFSKMEDWVIEFQERVPYILMDGRFRREAGVTEIISKRDPTKAP
jgi:hypothetical protein